MCGPRRPSLVTPRPPDGALLARAFEPTRFRPSSFPAIPPGYSRRRDGFGSNRFLRLAKIGFCITPIDIADLAAPEPFDERLGHGRAAGLSQLATHSLEGSQRRNGNA